MIIQKFWEERTIKYVSARVDSRYSAKESGDAERLEAMIYPSALLTAKLLPIPEERFGDGKKQILKYTKHYYASTSLSTGIGYERIASFLGTGQSVGLYCDSETTLIPPMDAKVLEAGAALEDVFAHFDKTFDLDTPHLYGSNTSVICAPTQITQSFGAYWYHPDHLGSSSYITNLNGEISQHMEYLPFGETLVEEHLNSNNSPYKFNAKEFDAETGNYYYGARYYDPKWSIWLSVDAEFARFPSYSPYNYTLLNPINLVDPDGNAPIRPIPPINPIDIHNGIKAAGKYLNSLMVGGYNFVSSRGTNKNQRKDINNETKTINVDDIIAVSPSSAKGINAKGSLVKKTVEGASDAVESVNKVKEIFGIDKPNNNQADNKSVPSFTFDFWKNEEPHGGGDGAIGIEAAIQRKNELQKQFPDLDITIRPVDQPHPHNQKYETE